MGVALILEQYVVFLGLQLSGLDHRGSSESVLADQRAAFVGSYLRSTRTSFFPGSILSISSNGNSSGIVWSINADQFLKEGSAIVMAHDASNVTRLLWASDQNPARDGAGTAFKFGVPTVTNGKVYASDKLKINVYGILPTIAPAPAFTPAAGPYSGSVNVTMVSTFATASMYYTLDGTTPTTASRLYTGGFNLTATATVRAIAVVPDQANSAVASATYTITPATSSNVGLTSFTSAPMIYNGSALGGSAVTLTNGLQGQAASAYYSIKAAGRHLQHEFQFRAAEREC